MVWQNDVEQSAVTSVMEDFPSNSPWRQNLRISTLSRTFALSNKLYWWSGFIYRVSRRECARLRENVPYVKVHRYNPKHLYRKLNGYRDNGERKVWASCGSTYCTCFACCYPYTAHVRPSVSQPNKAHSAFIINRCHSYSEL